MTHAEARDLLELSADDVGDLQRIRAAHQRRRREVQAQLDAAAAAPLRAAYQQTVDALDVAVAMLLASTQGGGSAPVPGERPEAPPAPDTPAEDEKSDWITATPWNAIENEATGDFRSADEGFAGAQPLERAPSRRPARPQQPPAPPAGRPQPRPALPRPKSGQAGNAPGQRRPVSMTVKLPDSLLDRPPVILPEEHPQETAIVAPARSTPTRLARARPEMPFLADENGSAPAQPPPPAPSEPRRRLVPLLAALLVLAGTIGLAAWAWQQGAIDRLLSNVALPELTDGNREAGGLARRPPRSPDNETDETSSGAKLASGDDTSDREPAGEDDVAPAPNLAESQVREIETLGDELYRLTRELDAPLALDWPAELAAAERAQQAGDADESAVLRARLHDRLRAEIESARKVLTARQRLDNAGAMGRDVPLAALAADHVAALTRAADTALAGGDYTAAAAGYEEALDARLRLPREAETADTSRRTAQEGMKRLRTALEKLGVARPAPGPLSDLLARDAALTLEGPSVRGWLAGEMPGQELNREYQQLAANLEESADKLERIVLLRARLEASLGQLSRIESEIAGIARQPEQLASWLDEGASASDVARRQEAAVAVREGRLDEALRAYEAGATDADERLEAAVLLRDLLARRAKAAESLEGVLATAEELEAVVRQLEGLDDGPVAESAARVSAQISQDRQHLRQLATTAAAPLPGDPGQLEPVVRQAEVRAQAAPVLAAGVARLADAERRVLLLRTIVAEAQAEGATGVRLPLPKATEARALLERWGDPQRTFSPQDVMVAEQALEEAAAATDTAARQLAEPAASALVRRIRQRQASYRETFGNVDLERVWQPQRPIEGTQPPSELAEPVAAALAAEVDEAALKRSLDTGIAEAEALLGHVRSLDQAATTLGALHQAAEEEDASGQRALHRSASSGAIDDVRALLALGVTPNPRDAQDRTPLGLAISAGHAEVVELLLEAGGRPQRWLEAGRPIVFDAAANPAALRLLLEHGAPARDLHRGETALHALAWQANRGQVPVERQLESARLLLDAGVDPALRNRAGQSSAELASNLGLRELAELLREAINR